MEWIGPQDTRSDCVIFGEIRGGKAYVLVLYAVLFVRSLVDLLYFIDLS
jgi:hypothetical protein